MNEALYGKKILFATVPSDGHINPLTGLAKYLKEAGCDVRWYTSRIFEEKLKRLSIPLYIFTKALDINPINLEYIFPEREYITDQPEKLNFDLINIFAKRSSEYYADIKTIYGTFPFDLMICDSMFSAIPFVKAKMNIPVVSVGMVPLATDSVDLASYGMALTPAATASQHAEYARLRDFVSTVLFKRSIDVYEAILRENDIEIERAILFDLLIRQSDLYLQIGVPGFEYKRSDLGDNIRFVGTMMPYSNKKENRTWFDERVLKYDKTVLVTQGTAESDLKNILEPTLEALKDTDTLVIVTTGGNGTLALREKYKSSNLIIESYIPFDEVMPYASLCITNGGYMTTLLSITHKLPIITSGIHGGKNEVGTRVAYFNCGINLNVEIPASEAIRDAVQEILSNYTYKSHVSQLSDELKKYDAYQLSASYIAELLNENVVLPGK